MGALMTIMDRISGGEITGLQQAVEAYGRELAVERASAGLLRESVADLQMQLEEGGYMQLGKGEGLSRADLVAIARRARMFYLRNPLARRAVYTQTAYVFGQGVEFSAAEEDAQDDVDAITGDRGNRRAVFGHQALMELETALQLDGNVFIAVFSGSDGSNQVRTLPHDQVTGVVTNPDDASEPWYYLREWTVDSKQYRLAYPELGLEKPEKSIEVDGRTWEVDTARVLHVRVNATADMAFGASELTSAMPWARSYTEFLEDWATIVKSLSRYAWKVQAAGGQAGVDALTAKLGSNLTSSTMMDTNLPPAVGSMLVTSGVEVEPMPKGGATVSVNDGRRLLLMVSAATGIFEHYMGDPSTGNLATATAMERPMELQFRDRQQLWADTLGELLTWCVGSDVTVNFPPVLEKDVAAMVDAIVKGTTLANGTPAGTISLPLATKMILTALDEPDPDGIVARLFGDDWRELTWDDMSAVADYMEALRADRR